MHSDDELSKQARAIANVLRKTTLGSKGSSGAGFAAEVLLNTPPASRKRMLKELKKNNPRAYRRIEQALKA